MITTLKLAGLSAAMSAGLVTGFDASAVKPTGADTGKIFYDRVEDSHPSSKIVVAYAYPAGLRGVATASTAKGDRLQPAPEAGSPDRHIARTITIESRPGAQTSTLVRVQTTATASR